MKKILLLTFILSLFISGFAQRPIASKEIRNFKAKMILPSVGEQEKISQNGAMPLASPVLTTVDEEVVGKSFYDLQTNSTVGNRIVAYDDGTMGAVWTFSGETGFTDRGTGYNYFDGSDWGDYPTVRLEDDRTGWPSYAAWGENGEINVCHYAGAASGILGLAITKRETKGTEDDWTQVDFHSPASNADYAWPNMVTGGEDNSVMHLIALTRPIANAGALYEGINGAILYSRSEDGGDTWSIDGQLFPELNSDHYKNFGGDGYTLLAEGDNVAFIYGDGWTDFGMMKSTDGGDTWTQTIIWEHPYPLFSNQAPIATEAFYCNDGAFDIAFDQSGMAHVVFGINRSSCDGTWPGSWYPGVGGIGYWNEDRPTFSADTNALCPYPDDPELCSYSELVEDYSLIGWDQDVNGNDTLDWTEADPASFYVGTSSMPEIIIDDMNRIFVVYSSITETYTSGSPEQTCRHLWARTSPNGEWWGSFTDITASPIHIIDDCVYPSITESSDGESIVVVYQHDNQPGNSLQGNPATAIGENSISVMTVQKDEIWTSVKENNIPVFDYDVMQNYPNPFTGSSTVKVNVRQTTTLSLEVVNMMGQVVYTVDAGVAQPGMNTINIDGTKLTTGVYFYTVKAGETAITKKMIVE